MEKRKVSLKKVAVVTGAISVLLVAILIAHIYAVTRPKSDNQNRRVMARIDFKEDISADDANKIATWLYKQKGVDHVLCNPDSDIAVFTFSSAANNADYIVDQFVSVTGYKAARFMPDKEAMMSGCPVMADTWTGKIYNLFKRI